MHLHLVDISRRAFTRTGFTLVGLLRSVWCTVVMWYAFILHLQRIYCTCSDMNLCFTILMMVSRDNSLFAQGGVGKFISFRTHARGFHGGIRIIGCSDCRGDREVDGETPPFDCRRQEGGDEGY